VTRWLVGTAPALCHRGENVVASKQTLTADRTDGWENAELFPQPDRFRRSIRQARGVAGTQECGAVYLLLHHGTKMQQRS